MQHKAPKDNWGLVEVQVDSGAVDNVANRASFLEYRLRESEGSRNGLHYLAANDGKIKKQGGATPDVQEPRWHPIQVSDAGC